MECDGRGTGTLKISGTDVIGPDDDLDLTFTVTGGGDANPVDDTSQRTVHVVSSREASYRRMAEVPFHFMNAHR